MCYFHFYNNVQKIYLYHKKQLLLLTAQLNSLNRSAPEYRHKLNVKTFHSIMNIVHNRSNTLTLYPNWNSSFTIIWSEVDTWNPPVCALHTANSYNCQHINTDQYRPPQCKVIWFIKCIHQTPFIYLGCWKITRHSLTHTHTHTHTQTNKLQPRTINEVIQTL